MAIVRLFDQGSLELGVSVIDGMHGRQLLMQERLWHSVVARYLACTSPDSLSGSDDLCTRFLDLCTRFLSHTLV